MIKNILKVIKGIIGLLVIGVFIFFAGKEDKKSLDKIRKDIYEKDIADVVDSINTWLS